MPHSLAYMERDSTVCVADREGRQVLCYSAGPELGRLRLRLGGPRRLGRVYAVAASGKPTLATRSSAFIFFVYGFKAESWLGTLGN